MNLRKTLFLLACLSIFLTPAILFAQQERILSFDSHIEVLVNSDVVVSETIRVLAAGQKIRRGIYRDFPTRYRNNHGGEVTVRFEVLEVLRDNRPEAYHTEPQSNGVRVYMGSKDVFLQPGEYTYTLTYRSNRQIGFFDEYDELYWNVTGNGWDFVIDKARAAERRFNCRRGPRWSDMRGTPARSGPAAGITRSTRPWVILVSPQPGHWPPMRASRSRWPGPKAS